MSDAVNPTIHTVFRDNYFEPAKRSLAHQHTNDYAAYLTAREQFKREHGFDYEPAFRTFQRHKNGK